MYPSEEERQKEIVYLGPDTSTLVLKPYKQEFVRNEPVKVTIGMAEVLVPLKEFKAVDKKKDKPIGGN